MLSAHTNPSSKVLKSSFCFLLFVFAESAVLVCKEPSTSQTKNRKPPIDGSSLTAPVPPSRLLGKVKHFLGVMSDANKRLELDAKDNPKNYDIEELTGNESEVIEMDLMLGVADLHTPEAAAAAAESAISTCQPVIPLADSSETDSDESNVDEGSGDDGRSDDEDDGDSEIHESSLFKSSLRGKDDTHSRQMGNHHSKKRPKIVELSQN